MTQAELIEIVARRSRTTKRGAVKVLLAFMRTVSVTVSAGETVPWRRFGVFYLKRISSRRIVAPRGAKNEGDLITLPAQTAVGFRPARAQKRKERRR